MKIALTQYQGNIMGTLTPTEKLEIYLRSMRMSQKAGVSFQSSGSDLDELIKAIEFICPDIEEYFYQKELNENAK